MTTIRVIFELRFRDISLAFSAKGMLAGEVLAREFRNFEVVPARSISFKISDFSRVVLDNTHLAVDLLYEEAKLTDAKRWMERLVGIWEDAVGPAPPLQRIGFRVQSILQSDMTREELSHAYAAWLLSDVCLRSFPSTDFAMVFENFDAEKPTDGDRLQIGPMSYPELVQKWQLAKEMVPEAASYLTTDIDIGKADMSHRSASAFADDAWARAFKHNHALSTLLK